MLHPYVGFSDEKILIVNLVEVDLSGIAIKPDPFSNHIFDDILHTLGNPGLVVFDAPVHFLDPLPLVDVGYLQGQVFLEYPHILLLISPRRLHFLGQLSLELFAGPYVFVCFRLQGAVLDLHFADLQVELGDRAAGFREFVHVDALNCGELRLEGFAGAAQLAVEKDDDVLADLPGCVPHVLEQLPFLVAPGFEEPDELLHAEAHNGVLVLVDVGVGIGVGQLGLEPVLQLLQPGPVGELGVDALGGRDAALGRLRLELVQRSAEEFVVLLRDLVGDFEGQLGRQQRRDPEQVGLRTEGLRVRVVVIQRRLPLQHRQLVREAVLYSPAHPNEVFRVSVVEDGRGLGQVVLQRIRQINFGELHSVYDYSKGKHRSLGELLTNILNMKVKEVGKYQVQDLVGEGSFGKVYRAIDRTSNEMVALKFIPRKGKNRKDMESLRQEIEILKKLKHDNIIQLRDHIENQNQIILVTEFAGKDLSTILEKQRKLKLEEIKHYVRQIVSALLYLNDNRIVHRDLKPQNILIRDGIVKLCDFGFARKMSAATICLHSLKGTPLYIAPEIISEKPYNHKIDIWSLGIIIYELYTGIPPFHADTYYKLLPKILHDKVKYPSSMDVELRELIEGMLQKAPSSRYDWDQITQHPFLKNFLGLARQDSKAERQGLSQISDFSNKVESQIEKDFPIDTAKLRPSNLANHTNKVEIEQLKQYEEDLKTGKLNGKQLKTNVIFYHKLVSLFSMSSLGEKISKELLTIAFRVLTILITKVKLDLDQREEDITKKKDLLMAVTTLILSVDEDDTLAQVFNLIAYLLKNNFDTLQIDLEPAEEIVYASSTVLAREKVSGGTLINLLKCIGILANQAIMTLHTSQELLEIVNQTKLLSLIAGKFQPDREYIIVLQCLEKFIHPIKGQQAPVPKILKVIQNLKKDTAQGFVDNNLVGVLGKAVDNYNLQEMEFFWHVFYECIKVDEGFRKAVLAAKCWQSLHLKNKTYSMAVNFLLIRDEKQQLASLDTLKQEVTQIDWNSDSELSKVFQISILHIALTAKPESKQRFEWNKLLARKAAELLVVDDAKKQKSLESIEGWAFGQPCFKFDDILVDLLASIDSIEKSYDKDRDLTQLFEQCKIYDSLIRIKNGQLNITTRTLSKALSMILCYYKQQKGPSKKLTLSLIEALPLILNEDDLNKIRENQGDDAQISFLINVFTLMKELTMRDQKRMTEFYTKTQGLNLHRLIVSDHLLTERILGVSLGILLKALQKSNSTALDYMAVTGIQKLRRWLASQNVEILLDLVQILSHLARSKVDYYPNILQIGVVDQIPRYLSGNSETLKEKTLNLVGNLAKHSVQFFEEFARFRIMAAVANSINSKTSNFERIIKNIVYAIGNVSYYNQQFREDIRPLIPHFYIALSTEQDHLMSNTISTLSNLLRHSNYYLKDLTANRVTSRIFQIIRTTTSQSILVFSLNFLQKAVQYPEFVAANRDQVMYAIRGVNTGASDSQASKKIKKIMQKL